MTDLVSLSAGLNNIENCVELAQQCNLGIEVMAFSYPEILDGDWRATVKQYKRLLDYVPGPITLHGPFMDMVSGSPDPRVNAVSNARFSHAIRIAAELGAHIVVFHTNFIGTLHNAFYRIGWHQRNVAFWRPLADYAQQHGVVIALENMWEFDPTIIGNLLEEVNHPCLRACLDVGHAHVFSDKMYDFDYWLRVMEPWIIEYHMNNNNGIIDEHHGFDWDSGALDYNDILPKLRALNTPLKPPVMVLEMNHVKDMSDSLYYFQLAESISEEP